MLKQRREEGRKEGRKEGGKEGGRGEGKGKEGGKKEVLQMIWQKKQTKNWYFCFKAWNKGIGGKEILIPKRSETRLPFYMCVGGRQTGVSIALSSNMYGEDQGPNCNLTQTW